ncbi:DNA-binding protein [Pseudoduganella sp. UC29_106]|uniref:helix-turn-helix domain-containing transcriptional regulator n=1 Tax=Pseudoduganella sp. UC29_106 TaxID=3374553 RepID=UPI0037575668
MDLEISEWDTARYLETRDDIYRYLLACLEEVGLDAAALTVALNDIARSRGLAEITSEIPSARQSLDAFLRHQISPDIQAVATMLAQLGFPIAAKPI